MHNKLILILIGLILLLGGGMSGAEENPVNSQIKEAQAAKYPPYPNVWDWHDRSIQKSSILVIPFSLYAISNGDVLIKYYRKYAKGKKMEAHAAMFFERKNFAGVIAERLIDDAKKYLQNTGGKRTLREKLAYKALSRDGIWKIKSIIPYDLNCYAGPNRHPYKLTNTKTGEEKIFTIFRLLDKPEKLFVNGKLGQFGTKDYGREFPNASCIYEARRTVEYKVKSIYGNFLFLLDNSFLFQDEETGGVIRFDINLKSNSELMGNALFLIENSGTPWVMDDLTDYDYENCEVDVANKTTDDLFKYLKDRRRR